MLWLGCETGLAGKFFFTGCLRIIILSAHKPNSVGLTNSLAGEDEMKTSAALLAMVLAGSVFVTARAGAEQAAEKKEAEKKENRWQGTVVRINKDESSLDVRGGTPPSKEFTKKIVYDSSTEWTNLGKPGKQEDVKEGSFVIVLGKNDEKGVLHATRVDLRLPR